MSTKKNPGLSARSVTVAAALEAHGTKKAEPAPAAEGKPPVPFSLRLPVEIHDELRRISFDTRESIHSLILDGVRMRLEQERKGR